MTLSKYKNTSTPAASLSRRWLITAFVVFLVGFLGFISLYTHIQGYLPPSIDLSIMNWMISHRLPFITSVMEFITNALSPISFAIIVLLTAGLWAWRKKEVWRPALLLTGMGMAFVLGAVIKAGVERSRPPIEHMIAPFELDFAFPSGHVIGVATFTFILGYLLCSRKASALRVVSWIVVATTSTALVAFSRMYLGYHWLSDTLAATCLALIILASIMLIDRALTKRPVTTEAASSNDQ